MPLLRFVALLLLASLASPALPAFAIDPEALRLNEAATGLLTKLGGAYDRANVERAVELLRQATALAPEDATIRQNYGRARAYLGQAYHRSGDLAGARQQLEAALDLTPSDAGTLLTLGIVYDRLGNTAAAVHALRRAVSAGGNSLELYLTLGDLLYRQGDLDAARHAWEEGRRRLGDNPAFTSRLGKLDREQQVTRGYRAQDSQHFVAQFQGAQPAEAERILQILEQAYGDIGYWLGAYPDRPVHVHFLADADFAAVTGLAGAVRATYHGKDRKIRVCLNGSLDDPGLKSTLYHEHTHALVDAITHGYAVPAWLHEGLAVHAAQQCDRSRPQLAALRDAKRPLPSFTRSPYMIGMAAGDVMIQQHGASAILRLLRQVGAGQPFPAAFEATFGVSPATFEQQLPQWLR